MAGLTHIDDILMQSKQEFFQLQTYRAVFASHWEEVAELLIPTSRNTFFFGSYNFPGQKKTDRQVDTKGALALMRFAAILDSLLTPRNMMWHMLGTNDTKLLKNRDVKLWFEKTTKTLFKYRYAPIANFSGQNSGFYESLGAFGTGSMFADQACDEGGRPVAGIRYRALPIGEMFYGENHQGLISRYCRWFRLTGQQAVAQFGDACPPRLLEQAKQYNQWPYNFLQRVVPRGDEYDPDRKDKYGKRFASYYLCLDTDEVIGEGGYRKFPVAAGRYIQTPGEVYGRSPGMLALPSLKTINAEKRDFLTQGHRAAAPVLLTADDGVANLSLRPNAINPGFMSPDGKRLVDVLPSGNIQVSKEMMDEEGACIDGFFLVDLFKILLGDPKIFTATQIVEMMSQRGILVAPTIGRQQSEYLGPLIDRELDILSAQHLLDPMPPALLEARGEYEVNYTSPLARDQKAGEVAGFQRTLETALSIVNATQDPSALDTFDVDTIMPAVSEINGMPTSWTASAEKIAAKRAERAKQAEIQQKIQAAPAAAAMMKAKAAAGLPPQTQTLAPLPAPGTQ